jgi:arsenate reductase
VEALGSCILLGARDARGGRVVLPLRTRPRLAPDGLSPHPRPAHQGRTPSTMAAGLLDRYAEGRVHVRSAGSTPANEINPAVVTAMDEIGIDLSREFPKPLTTEVVKAADVVITMGCGDACPIYPGKRYLDWDLPDPAGKSVEEVRLIRDQIDRRVRELVRELVGELVGVS